MSKKYRQFILRLDPNTPQDAKLIAHLDSARRTWGGVQQFLKNAALSALPDGEGGKDAIRAAREFPDTPSKEPSAMMTNALRRAMPTASESALLAMASSNPLANMRALYAALETFSPASLTETEAKLLQVFCDDVNRLLQTAAQERLPIRKIIQGDEQ